MEGNGLYSPTRPGRIPQRVVYALLFTLVVVVIVLLLPKKLSSADKYSSGISIRLESHQVEYYTYNSTYPLSLPISESGSVIICVLSFYRVCY